MIVKVPLSSGGGDLYFSKTDRLEVQFIRKLPTDGIVRNPFSGVYEFIDMDTYEYKRITFKNGIKTASISTAKRNQGSIQSSSMRSTSWLLDLLQCIARYIFAVPSSDGHCWILGGGGSTEEGRSDPNLGSGSGDSPFDWGNWFAGNNPPIYPPSGPSNPWNPYYGGGVSGTNPTPSLGATNNYLFIDGIGYVPILNNWNNWNPEEPFNIDGVLSQPSDDEPFVNLGYEILEITDDPQPGNYPKRMLAHTVDRSNVEEKDFGYNGDASFVRQIEGRPLMRRNQDLGNDELIDYLRFTKNIFSYGGINGVATAMVNKFASKSGGEFRHSQLNEKVKNSNGFKNFTQKLANRFNNELRSNSGNIDNVIDFVLDQNDRPKFTAKENLFNGLTFLLNDTNETLVEITDFNIVNGKWTAKVVITIKDWFGVDTHDVKTYQYAPLGVGFGFAAWWLLQHTRGYPPIQTIVSLGLTLTGNL